MSNLWELTKIKPETDIVVPGETMPAIFWNAAKKRGPNTWLRQKKFGIWQTWTWNQAAQVVKDIANGLIALGFNPQETASVLSNTKAEWVFVDLAILSAGGVSNGIYPTDSSDQVQYLCEDSTTTILFVEDDEQLDKALDARQRLPHLRKIVVEDLEGLRGFEDPQVISLEELQKIGRNYGSKNPDALDARLRGINPEDLAILIYTSGTTGKPKGGMHNHRGIISAMHGLNTLYPQYENDERMCFLPLCHVAERFWGEYFAVYTGTILNFVENPETVPENMQEIAPTVMTAVPRIWEKFYSSITIAIKDATRLQQQAYQWSIGTGYKVAGLFVVSHGT